MQKIPLALAKAGMVLAKPVLRDNSLVLVAEGAELSDTLLERLQRMDVEAVTVQGNPVDMDGAAGGTRIGERLERLDHLFRKHQHDPFMGQLKGWLREYFQLKAAQAAAAAAVAEAAEAPKNGEK